MKFEKLMQMSIKDTIFRDIVPSKARTKNSALLKEKQLWNEMRNMPLKSQLNEKLQINAENKTKQKKQ